MVTNADSDTLRLMGSWAKSRRKVVWKDQLSNKRSLYHWVVCLPRKFILREEGKLGLNHNVKFSKDTWHHIKIRKRKGPSRDVTQKCEPHERNPCASKFTERTQEETMHQERFPRGVTWGLTKSVYKLKNTNKATCSLLLKPGQRRRPTSKYPNEQEFVIDYGASVHMLSKHFFFAQTKWRLCGDPGPPQPTEKVQTNEEAQVYVHDLDLFVTVLTLDDTSAKYAKRKTSCLLLPLDCRQILVLVRPLNLHRRTRQVHLQVQHQSAVTNSHQETGAIHQKLKTKIKKKDINRASDDRLRDLPEWLEEITENLGDTEVPAPAHISHDSDSERPTKVTLMKHSVYTHLPKDRNCDIYLRTKLRGLLAENALTKSLVTW